ncbi:MAG TPA: 16S rRNA (cytosine(1402)-N(4))-methyltransferase RsmH [Thermoanaerobaculia bacterium]|nr:16S rRNA (cytosine(1402)-N(4))-methyltransferase RsmH [Thermoanaerobaculia bacterium]
MVEQVEGPKHDPVLLEEVIELATPARPDGILVDATVGLGGHARALLARWPDARLIGIDRDPRALEIARERLAMFSGRVRLCQAKHETLIEILDGEMVDRIDLLLADLGVSSLQLDEASRGFSFRAEGPLDMRMGEEGLTAADLVNELDEKALARLLREWGEEPMAGPIARAIVRARGEAPIETTLRLAEIVRTVKKPRRDRIDPATLTFQALRIAANEELTGLAGFLESGIERLRPGGRIAVISFHSLEDRIVKQTFRKLEGECICPPGMPVCGCGAVATVKVITRRPVTAGDEEQERNPRARSAKLRVAERVQERGGKEQG